MMNMMPSCSLSLLRVWLALLIGTENMFLNESDKTCAVSGVLFLCNASFWTMFPSERHLEVNQQVYLPSTSQTEEHTDQMDQMDVTGALTSWTLCIKTRNPAVKYYCQVFTVTTRHVPVWNLQDIQTKKIKNKATMGGGGWVLFCCYVQKFGHVAYFHMEGLPEMTCT